MDLINLISINLDDGNGFNREMDFERRRQF